MRPLRPWSVETLQEFVAKRLAELNLSVRQAAERSRGHVPYSTIRNLAQGLHGGQISDRIAEGPGGSGLSRSTASRSPSGSSSRT